MAASSMSTAVTCASGYLSASQYTNVASSAPASRMDRGVSSVFMTRGRRRSFNLLPTYGSPTVRRSACLAYCFAFPRLSTTTP